MARAQELSIWDAALLPARGPLGEPGEVLGPVVSPAAGACGQLVACGSGGVVLLELESDTGTMLGGRELSGQLWTGKRFGVEVPVHA